MKALTVRQPWASLIALGTKRIETRSWQTRYRGPIAIHAGQRRPEHGLRIGPGGPVVIEEWLVYTEGCNPPLLLDLCNEEAHLLPLGAIVATANLVDVVPMIDDDVISPAPYIRLFPSGVLALRIQDAPAQRSPLDVSDQAPYGDFAPGRFAWLLADIVPCDPVPAKGKQGLWTWDGGAA